MRSPPPPLPSSFVKQSVDSKHTSQLRGEYYENYKTRGIFNVISRAALFQLYFVCPRPKEFQLGLVIRVIQKRRFATISVIKNLGWLFDTLSAGTSMNASLFSCGSMKYLITPWILIFLLF